MSWYGSFDFKSYAHTHIYIHIQIRIKVLKDVLQFKNIVTTEYLQKESKIFLILFKIRRVRLSKQRYYRREI